jgi:hydrogenase maturation protease
MSTEFPKSTELTTPSILIIGVGNLYRHDDAVGLLIARRLKKSDDKRLTVLEQNGDGLSLMETWKEWNCAILIDAVSSRQAPGTVHYINANEKPIPSKFFSCSTHNMGVAEAVELSRSFDRLPKHLAIYGVEGKDFSPGEGLSQEVEEAMDQAVKKIYEKVESLCED